MRFSVPARLEGTTGLITVNHLSIAGTILSSNKAIIALCTYALL